MRRNPGYVVRMGFIVIGGKLINVWRIIVYMYIEVCVGGRGVVCVCVHACVRVGNQIISKAQILPFLGCCKSHAHITHPHTLTPSQEVKSYPVHCIKIVEKVDEGAFHRKHMFQIVILLSGQVPNPDTPPEISLYLQAAVSHVELNYASFHFEILVGCRVSVSVSHVRTQLALFLRIYTSPKTT